VAVVTPPSEIPTTDIFSTVTAPAAIFGDCICVVIGYPNVNVTVPVPPVMLLILNPPEVTVATTNPALNAPV
jgi:hypothetical protein